MARCGTLRLLIRKKIPNDPNTSEKVESALRNTHKPSILCALCFRPLGRKLASTRPAFPQNSRLTEKPVMRGDRVGDLGSQAAAAVGMVGGRRIGRGERDALSRIAADDMNVDRDRLGVRIATRAYRVAGDDLVPLRPEHPKSLQGPVAAGRDVNRAGQAEITAGDGVADRLAGLRPDHRVAAP